MTSYRRQDSRDQWHWRADCPNYPKTEYEEHKTNARKMDLCEQCRALDSELPPESRPADEAPIVIEIPKPVEDTSGYSAEHWNTQALVDYHKFNLEAALKSVNKSLEISSKQALTWYHKGMILAEMEAYEQALAAYDECLSQDNKNLLCWLNKSDMLVRLGNVPQALSNYNLALKVFPKDAILWFRAAKLYARMKDKPNTLACISQAVALETKVKQLAEKDVDFQRLKDDPDVRQLLN